MKFSLVIALLLINQLAAAATGVWKSTIEIPDDPLFSEKGHLTDGQNFSIKWSKFTIIPQITEEDEPTTVYFQNSKLYRFHYDFAFEHLPMFSAITPQEFNQKTLYSTGRKAVLGALLLIQDPLGSPVAIGIELVGNDAFSREEIVLYYNHVLASVSGLVDTPHYYLPTFAQTASTRAEEEWLRTNGIIIETIQRWSTPIGIHAEGWAIGRLVELAADDIDKAYKEGRLKPTDILLTDRIPAEIPFVAGVVSRQAATPNSHVAILAESWNIPFVSIHPSIMDLSHLVGKRVTLSAMWDVRIDAVPTDISDEAYAAILALKSAPSLVIPEINPSGALWLEVDELTPDDINKVGGKAAHFGLLRSSIPQNSDPAIAFTFDLWNEYMAQVLPESGRTLKDEIATLLEPFQSYPPDFAEVSDALKKIKSLIRKKAVFSAAQQAEILEVLGEKFDPDLRIRFRSSTNVEDSDNFTGAGLYDSNSGCLMDDLHPNAPGPSYCNPDRPEKQGVFQAMQKVYASFYNENAFLERLRHGIDENEVGMAILVHHSFPDEIEMANGVAVVSPRYFKDELDYLLIDLVTQKGAESVTNPTGDAIPEVAQGYWWRWSPAFFAVEQKSNLLLLGEETVMEKNADYVDLANLLKSIQQHYAQLNPTMRARRLEFEFKKIAPSGDLVVKQVRPLPPEVNSTHDDRLLMGGELELVLFQGEASSVHSNHRAKSLIHLNLNTTPWDANNGGPSPIALVNYTRPANGQIIDWTGDPRAWPGYTSTFSATSGNYSQMTHSISWNEDLGGQTVTRSLLIEPPSYSTTPWLYPNQMNYSLITHYPNRPAPWWTEIDNAFIPPQPLTNVSERAFLMPQSHHYEPKPTDRNVQISFKNGPVEFEISFYYPPYPTGITSGYTAPLRAWDKTVINGMTSSPIELRGAFAQTFRPEHHNFGLHFVFEPRLEPGLAESTLAELEQQNIQAIRVNYDYLAENRSSVFLIDASGIERDILSRWFGEVEYIDWSQFCHSSWWGFLHVTEFPTIYHDRLGWMFIDTYGDLDNLWLWKFNDLGWLWTNQHTYPHFYHLNAADWIYFWPESSHPEWWFHYATGEWQAH